MDHWFGFRGLWRVAIADDQCLLIYSNYSKAYLGIAENKVAPGKREERKSVGVERYVNSSKVRICAAEKRLEHSETKRRTRIS